MDEQQSRGRKAVIGNIHGSFWLYDSEAGYDLTHPPTPLSPSITNGVRIETTTKPITIDPAKSALIIVDMQNFFLSTALGRSPSSKGLKAQQALLQHAIPAARKAGIHVIWLNWGLTDADIDRMPPAVVRAFGFESVEASHYNTYAESRIRHRPMTFRSDEPSFGSASIEIETLGKKSNVYRGLGNSMGSVTLSDGSVVDAGRMLMRNQWNTALTPELSHAYQQGLTYDPPDTWIHKNRMSGLWGHSTSCTDFLDGEGIRTLFFAEVNTDQCVGGSLTDAFSKGYDCILLSDGAATSSPEDCQTAYEYNAAGAYGFCTSCTNLAQGVEAQRT